MSRPASTTAGTRTRASPCHSVVGSPRRAIRADSAANLVADAPGRARFSLVMLPPLCDAFTEVTEWNATRTILSDLLRWKRGLPRLWLVGVRSAYRNEKSDRRCTLHRSG